MSIRTIRDSVVMLPDHTQIVVNLCGDIKLLDGSNVTLMGVLLELLVWHRVAEYSETHVDLFKVASRLVKVLPLHLRQNYLLQFLQLRRLQLGIGINFGSNATLFMSLVCFHPDLKMFPGFFVTDG